MQFDRSHRGKSESLTGLEEVLSCLQPCEFEDEQLSRFKGMCWADFVAFKDGQQPRGPAKPPQGEASPGEGGSDSEGYSAGEACDKEEEGGGAKGEDPREGEDTLTSLRHYPATERTLLLAGDKRAEVEKKPSPPDKAPPDPASRKKRPKPLMRAKTELSLGRNRAGPSIFSLLSEKMLQQDKTSSFAKPSATISEDKVASFIEEETALGLQTLNEPPPRAAPPEEEPGVGGQEEAADNAQAASARNETKRREAVWDLFQSECAFLYDHLMVLKNVSTIRPPGTKRRRTATNSELLASPELEEGRGHLYKGGGGFDCKGFVSLSSAYF